MHRFDSHDAERQELPKPIGRNSRADEQAYPRVFLCSDGASYLSGSVIYTDGGLAGGMVTGRLALGG